MGTYYEIKERDDSNAGEIGAFAVIVGIILTIIAVIAAVFFLFGTVGAIWGLILAIVNYSKSVKYNVIKKERKYPLSQGFSDLGNTITTFWKLNIESAKEYFDKAKYYDHILKILVQTLLFMVGVAVVFFGGIFFVLLCLLHIIIMVFYSIFTIF